MDLSKPRGSQRIFMGFDTQVVILDLKLAHLISSLSAFGTARKVAMRALNWSTIGPCELRRFWLSRRFRSMQ
jgi:hypothetical protein